MQTPADLIDSARFRCPPPRAGDRYVGYDYATKRPLEDFQLPAPLDELSRGVPLVSSLPVVVILGRQLQVDAIFHELNSNIIYVFSGMKFYTLQAADLKVSSKTFAAEPSRSINQQPADSNSNTRKSAAWSFPVGLGTAAGTALHQRALPRGLPIRRGLSKSVPDRQRPPPRRGRRRDGGRRATEVGHAQQPAAA